VCVTERERKKKIPCRCVDTILQIKKEKLGFVHSECKLAQVEEQRQVELRATCKKRTKRARRIKISAKKKTKKKAPRAQLFLASPPTLPSTQLHTHRKSLQHLLRLLRLRHLFLLLFG